MSAQGDLFAPAPVPAEAHSPAAVQPEPPAGALVAAPPPSGAGGGQWNAYVEGGSSKAERRVRLALCPAALRAEVEAHVRTVFALRERQTDPAFRAWAAAVRSQEADARRVAGLRKPSEPA